MSTTKIIKGWVSPGQARRSSDGYDGGIVRLNVYGPDEPNEGCDIYDYDEPATLYIGTGKLWTEDEVQAALSSKDAEIEALRNPWISVKDRLPIKERWVIVVADGAMNCAWYDKKRGWHNGFNERPKNIRIEEITHWMPLPTPPQP